MKPRIVVVLALLLLLMPAYLNAQVGPPPAAATNAVAASPLSQLSRAWTNGEIRYVTILSIPKGVHFPIHMRPEDLHTQYWFSLTVRRPTEVRVTQQLLEVVGSLKTHKSEEPLDVRWGFLFKDENEHTLHSIYTEGRSNTAEVDGARVEFEFGHLAIWADNTFGTILSPRDERR